MTCSRWLPIAALLLPATLAAHQAAPTPTPTQTPAASPSPTAIPIPAAPVGLLPPQPTTAPQSTPVPAPGSTPAAVPTPISRPAPRARPTPRPSAAATPEPSPTVAASPAPAIAPPPASPGFTPAIAPPASPASVSVPAGGLPWLPIAIGVLALAAIGALVRSRRRGAIAADVPPTIVEAAPPAPPRGAPVAPLPPPQPAAPAAPALTIELRPIRAGVNLLSAMVDSEVRLVNDGDVALEDARVEIRMIGAHAGQDADLAAIAATPITQPSVAPFALPPGGFVTLSAVATLPRASIVPLDAGGRPIFVPIVTVKVEALAAGTLIRQTAAFAVGIERADSARLAPFRLDAPPRTFDTVAARPHPIG